MDPARRQSPSPALPASWPIDTTVRFRRVLSTRRMNALQGRSQPSTPSSQLPSPIRQPDQFLSSVPKPSLQNIPLIPSPPTDRMSLRFRTMLHSLSQTPCRWENPGLLDEALGLVPLQQIYEQAQEQTELLAAEAASQGPNMKPAWGHEDCVVIALMRWFKASFFTWVNNPKCAKCNSQTFAAGRVAPDDEEQARGATRVELYKCSHPHCDGYERFPRYNDAFVLMRTRRGRLGEWATCFGMFCRAIGSRVRWVWNSEDYVWIEVYSRHRKRWVHVDVVEQAWDKPLLYTQGWNRKLGYCIAFSPDSATDVTRRYVRSPVQHALPRDKAPEAVLLHILDEIRSTRRRDRDKKDKYRLDGDDARELREFRQFTVESLARDLTRLIRDAVLRAADAQKAAEMAADAEWARARAEHEGGDQDARG